MNPKTFQAGVNSARSGFLKKLRYERRNGSTVSINKLIDWVLGQNERDDKREGGRGRKAK